jgi:hypothetical protein
MLRRAAIYLSTLFRKPLSKQFPDDGTNSLGVTPLIETERKFPGCRSLSFARRTKVVGWSISIAEEAEASSAGEQLAKEYSAGNSSHR